LNDISDTPTGFRGKTWIYVAQAAVFGPLGVFSLVMGPLFLFGGMKKADGTPATDAGIALSILSVPLMLLFALAMFNIRARRLPLLRLFREGLEIVLIGTSSLDEFPLPGLVRVAWSILSTQGFRRQVFRLPWECVRGARVSGLPMNRLLSILTAPALASEHDDATAEPPCDAIVLPEVMFKTPLHEIAQAIEVATNSPVALTRLPSWEERQTRD
jgi:hypothetical protein